MTNELISQVSQDDELEDVFYGQIVFIGARWFVIIGAMFLTLWHAESVKAVKVNLAPLAFLIAANFFLHARYLMDLPANATLLKLASALDLVIITLIVLFLNPGGLTGINNPFFVFYYPVVLAFSLVFTRQRTIVYTAAAILMYAAVCLLRAPGIHLNGDEELFGIRMVTLLGTALLGTMYWRIQRARRAAAGALSI